MFDDLSILKDAAALARYSAMRHQIIAENIANANTPGDRARDLQEFDAVYASREGAAGEWRPVESSSGPASPNGNTVSLQDQLMRGASAQDSHDAALTIYRKTLDILRVSLGR